jgi:carbonic anhydrase
MPKVKKHTHTCQAVIIHCMDFRLTEFVNNWAANTIPGGFDRVAIAGGAKNLPFVLDQVTLSSNLHGIREVYLINHEDCGAYGPTQTFAKHKNDLLTAKKVIQAKLPHLTVITLYLKMDGTYEWVY